MDRDHRPTDTIPGHLRDAWTHMPGIVRWAIVLFAIAYAIGFIVRG